MSALSTDNIGKCVEWKDLNSCEEGYKISNRGMK
jgi:hypothetical protein